MKRVLTYMRGLSQGLLKKLFWRKHQAVTGHSLYDQAKEEHGRSSEKGGFAGKESCDAEQDDYTTTIEQGRSQALSSPTESLDLAEAEKKRREQELAEMTANVREQVLKYLHKRAAEAESERIALLRAMEIADQQKHAALLSQEEAEEHLRLFEKKNGRVPSKKGFVDRFPWAFPVIGGFFDLPFTALAAISMGLPPIGAGAGALAMSGLMAFSSHQAGVSFQQKKWWRGAAWTATGLSAISAVAILRYGTPYFGLQVLLLAGFWGAGLLSAILYKERKEAFELKDAKDLADRTVIETTAQVTELEENYNGLEIKYTEIAHQDAQDALDQTKERLYSLERSLIMYKREIAKINAWFDEKLKEGLNYIRSCFAKGQHRRFKGRGRGGPGPFSRAAALSLLLLCVAPACDNRQGAMSPITEQLSPVVEHLHQVNLLLDKSASMSWEYKQDVYRVYTHILEITTLDKSGYVRDGVKLNIYYIGNQSIPRVMSLELPVGDPFAVANVPARDSAVFAFKQDLKEMLQKAFEQEASMNATRLHRAVAHSFSELSAGNAEFQTQIILSDFIEEGTVKFPLYAADTLKARRQEISAALLADAPLEGLSRIHVVLLAQSDPQSDDLCYRAAELFHDLYKDAGAHSVELKHNF